MKNFIGFLFLTIITNLQGQAIEGEGIDDIGVSGVSTNHFGVYGYSMNAIGLAGWSDAGSGARFYGGGGVAIELRGADSQWGDGSDDCVIATVHGPTADMILVSEDNFHIHLDDDATSTSEFAIFNGSNTKILTLTESGNMTITGTYSPSSDVNRKEKITQVDNRSILDKVAALSISEWQFKGEEIRHIGPMAQDFYAAFGLGQGETTISTVDADGIALAAIQELKRENDLLKQENEFIKNQILEFQKQLVLMQSKKKSRKRI